MVPLRLYFNDRGIAKLELGLAHGKRQYDKRQVERRSATGSASRARLLRGKE